MTKLKKQTEIGKQIQRLTEKASLGKEAIKHLYAFGNVDTPEDLRAWKRDVKIFLQSVEITHKKWLRW